MKTLSEIAQIVDGAARTATAIPQFEGENTLTVDDAYAVQAMSIGHRLDRGERRVGIKMGLTSRAKMLQVGVDEVIWGRLTDAMRVEEGGAISLANYVHPRVEPEIAFLLGAPLSGNVSPLEALAAVEAVAPALEIIDSRYENFKFSLGDVIADNASSSGFVVGDWHHPERDITNLGMIMEANGRAVQVGSSAAILGNPIRALVAGARMVARWGETLQPGWIVLAGGATAAHPLTAAGLSIRLSTQGLGDIGFTVNP